MRAWGLRIATAAAITTVAVLVFAPSQLDSGSNAPVAQPIAGSATERCTAALDLIRYENTWPLECRDRSPSDPYWGVAFPPPVGPPPWDNPRIEVYLGPQQDQGGVARAIAHELGHMHHTREADFEADWLRARGLAPNTPSNEWTEDYAEVFAALFGPPFDDWRAPTERPDPEQLEDLRRQFFTPEGAGVP